MTTNTTAPQPLPTSFLRAAISARLAWGLILAMAALGAGVVLYASDPIPWANSDSVEYAVSARNLIRGAGLGLIQASGRFSPVTHFPPLYPLVLATSAWFGADPLDLARWLNAGLIALLVTVAGACVIMFLGLPAFAVAASAAVVSSTVLLHLYSGAVSESLFLPLSLLSTVATVRYAQTQARVFLLAGAGFAAFAILTRYAGLSLLLSGPLILIALSSRAWIRRLLDGAAFGLASLVPLLGWTGYARARYGAEDPRQVDLVLFGLWDRLQGFRIRTVETLWSMIPFSDLGPSLGYRTKLALLLITGMVLVAFLAALLIRTRRERSEARETAMIGLAIGLAIFMGAYILGLGVASSMTNPAPDVDERVLSPLLVPAWLLLFACIALVRNLTPSYRGLTLAALMLTAAVVARAWPANQVMIAGLHVYGEQYSSTAWRSSGVLEVVRELPAGTPLISNDTAAILLLADRPAYDLPELVDGEPRPIDETFGDHPGDPVERKFREEGAALVLFARIRFQLEEVYGLEAQARLEGMTKGLLVLAETWDGAIYLYADGSGYDEVP